MGQNKSSGAELNSVEVLDMTTELWEQKLVHGTPPTGLWDTAYTVVGSCYFVFGGYEDESCPTAFSSLTITLNK